jgi:G8 domain
MIRCFFIAVSALTVSAPGLLSGDTAAESKAIRSAASGPWSAAATWEGGNVPGAGERVLIRPGHTVTYDAKSEAAVRAVQIGGKLTFARDRNTLLCAGLVRIAPGETFMENGFDCEAHQPKRDPAQQRAALEIGTAEEPIPVGKTATIRLTYVEGTDKETFPALVCCAGRMDLHGAPMTHTWTKLGEPAKAGDSAITTLEPVGDWRVGDRIIVTATTRQNKIKKTFQPTLRTGGQTEERIIRAVDGNKLTLDQPLNFDHVAEGDYRADVANLSRNVVIESADPAVARGHTMYHRDSAGSISYAEFRHLGKENVLGRYSMHFHLIGDTMRGTSVIGASIWDSGNRWITVHGTNYLVIRDCVGYQSVGHGFFLEDGTEVFNVLDHNLAVQAFIGKTLPKQVLPYDKNDGSGFWWANSHNTFTRNTAAECDEYGYFFQATKTADFDPVLDVQQPDGSLKQVDIRTLPFVRFENNESHCQRRHSLNLGGGAPFGPPNTAGIGPDNQHPFVVRGTKLWNVHWGINPVSPSVLIDGLVIHNAEYGVWRPEYKDHYYRDVKFSDVPEKQYYAFVSGKPGDEGQYPDAAKMKDDQPPETIVTFVGWLQDGKRLIRGTGSDNGTIRSIDVNGRPAQAVRGDFAEWQIELPVASGEKTITARATDAAGNPEPRPHIVSLP